ncbi:MAG: anhydro-N-acetylmuramic acid kinase, partial [Pseudomonadota bacterium]
MKNKAEGEARWALGMMSGTSMDGVDAALLRSDGARIAEFGPSHFRAYDDAERAALQEALSRAASAPVPSGAEDPRFAAARAVVLTAHRQAAERLMAMDGAPRPSLVGFHGQTVLHRPEQALTIQIGDGAALAAALGAPVVFDFRSADVAAGGQGAPFAPFYHAALARHAREAGRAPEGPIAFLNLGGVANATWVEAGAEDPAAPGALLAFDTGPANAMVDDWMTARAGARFDADGATALAGRADEALVAA